MTIYWRDIPAQVTATLTDGTKEQVLLDHRFQVAIDRAAAVAGLTSTDDYVNEWRRETTAVDGDAGELARHTAAQLETYFDRDRLEALVRAGGTATEHPDHPAQEDSP